MRQRDPLGGNRQIPTFDIEQAIQRFAGIPAIDQLLTRLLLRPRLLQLLFLLLGCGMIAWTVHSNGASRGARDAPPAAQPVLPANTRVPRAASPAVVEELIATVGAYNEASIIAAEMSNPAVLKPYLDGQGQAWLDAQREYARRARAGERHEAELVRWGVLRHKLDTDMALVETQEQWNDTTFVGDTIVNSRYGVLTRNVYELRRSSDRASPRPWIISTITTTMVTK